MKLESLSKFSNTYLLLALPQLASEMDASSSKKSGIPGTTGPLVVLLEVARTTPPDLYFFLKCAATECTACRDLAPRSCSRPSTAFIGRDVNVAHHGIIHRRCCQSLAVANAILSTFSRCPFIVVPPQPANVNEDGRRRQKPAIFSVRVPQLECEGSWAPCQADGPQRSSQSLP